MIDRALEWQRQLKNVYGNPFPILPDTLTERPRRDYWLQTYGLIMGPNGSECLAFDGVEDGGDFRFDSFRSIDEEWTSIGTNSFATEYAVDIGYEAAREKGIEVVLPYHWADVNIGGPYALFLGGALVPPEDDPDDIQLRAVYAEAVDCAKLELWTPPCKDICGDKCIEVCETLDTEYLTVRLRLYNPDDLYYLIVEGYDRHA